MRQLPLGKKLLFSGATTVVVIVLLNTVTAVLVPEHSVFWDNPLMMMYPVDHFDTTVTLDTLNHNTDSQRAVRYVPDPKRWYRLEPEPSIPHEGDLILHFGDSSTWGWWLKDRTQAYAGVLQTQLPANVHSINLGVPGYSSFQGLRYVEELIPEYRERITAITLYFGNNDATENGAPDSSKVRAEARWVTRWLRRVALYRVMRSAWQKTNHNSTPRVSPVEYHQNLQTMVDMAASYGIPVIIITPSVPVSWPPGHLTHSLSLEQHVTSRWAQEELRVAQQLYREGVARIEDGDKSGDALLADAMEHDWVMPRIKRKWKEQIASVRGSAVVEMEPIRVEVELPYSFVDYCHPSVALHEEIAHEILNALSELN